MAGKKIITVLESCPLCDTKDARIIKNPDLAGADGFVEEDTPPYKCIECAGLLRELPPQ